MDGAAAAARGVDLPLRTVSPDRRLLYAATVNRAAKRLPSWAVVVLLFVIPIVAVAATAYLVIAGDEPPQVAVAQGASGGAFHPVAGSFVADDTELDGCGADYPCLQQAFGNIAYRKGVKEALRLFEAQIEANAHVLADCHRISHVIGSAAFARYDGDVAQTFAVGSSTCASGYYHGILERAFVGVNTRAKLVKVARSLCAGSGIRRRGFLDYQCQHGLGHGLMIQTGYDLPIALETCDQLATRWDSVVCTGGVFMENVTTRFGFRSRWLEDDDSLYPCRSVPTPHRRSCYLRAPVRILALNDSDFAKTAATCASLGEEYATACFRGYGREAVSVARYETAKIVRHCRAARAHRGDCLYGAARTVGDGSGLPGARRAARLCHGSPREFRDGCFEGVGIVVGLLYPTDAARRAACARIAGAHAESCARAAIAEVHPSGRAAWG